VHSHRYGLADVENVSMLPTLRPGDVLLVRYRDRVRPGDVVLVHPPRGPSPQVKRVAWREPGGWWVERDNPRTGEDSFSYGPVPDADVLGRVLARIWPVARAGWVGRRGPAARG
jgi:nickel-type superoxide dismutase maturation protease